MEWNGKVCVVTGASSGIGKQTALDLAEAGATVCCVARRTAELDAIVRSLPGSGHTAFRADVTDRSAMEALAQHVDSTYGRCDVLVNNAGFSRGREFQGIESLEDIDAVMETNFFGVVNCTSYLLDLLERSAPSNVVNVASVAGRFSFGNASAYCASKFAVVGWSESIRIDLASRGVSVSLVEPGPIPTEGFTQEALVDHPVLRFALGSTEGVSAAIRNAVEGDKPQRVTPRWYYLLQIPKVVAPRLFRLGAAKVASPRVPKERKR
jgi:NAD(P)-dependent dehydrogenase (short-subunit alcohol dehydrogenase family)